MVGRFAGTFPFIRMLYYQLMIWEMDGAVRQYDILQALTGRILGSTLKLTDGTRWSWMKYNIHTPQRIRLGLKTTFAQCKLCSSDSTWLPHYSSNQLERCIATKDPSGYWLTNGWFNASRADNGSYEAMSKLWPAAHQTHTRGLYRSTRLSKPTTWSLTFSSFSAVTKLDQRHGVLYSNSVIISSSNFISNSFTNSKSLLASSTVVHHMGCSAYLYSSQ